MFCENCGTKIGDNVAFCPNCGSKVEGYQEKTSQQSVPVTGTSMGASHRPSSQTGEDYTQPSSQTPISGYHPKNKTGWLKYVLVLNWISIAGLVLLILIVMGTSTADIEEFVGDSEGNIKGVITGMLVLFAVLLIWLTVKLANFSNGARITFIVFAILGLLGALSSFDFFTLILQGLVLYALAFHQETVALFKDKQQQFGY